MWLERLVSPRVSIPPTVLWLGLIGASATIGWDVMGHRPPALAPGEAAEPDHTVAPVRFDASASYLTQIGTLDCGPENKEGRQHTEELPQRRLPFRGVLTIIDGRSVDAVRLRIEESGAAEIDTWRAHPGVQAEIGGSYRGDPNGVDIAIGQEVVVNVAGDGEQTVVTITCTRSAA